MLFNSLEFLIFFPIVLVVHYALPPRHRWVFLLAASYVFYAAWQPLYSGLIVVSTVVDYVVAGRIEQTRSRFWRRAWLAVSLTANLGMLFAFKYYNWINGTFAAWLGADWPLPELDLVLPVGISFYTFQTLSYTVDVFRGEQKREAHFGRFALYVAYFPQLVAGPIERASRLLPQLERPRPFDWMRIHSGLRLAAWGLFKKVVVADRLAEVVDLVYADPGSFGGFAHVVAIVFFSTQIYCDFSGYSDIAIGVARMLGVDLMKNFDQPYLARSIGVLWSRWHISMTTWFRDYVYRPLGGSRVGAWRYAGNVLIVMVLSGVWHGARWNLVLWGCLHAVLLVSERWGRPFWLSVCETLGLSTRPVLRAFVEWSWTYGIWLVTLVFFRAASLGDVTIVLTQLTTAWDAFGHLDPLLSLLRRWHLDGLLFAYCLLLGPLVELVEYAIRDERLRVWIDRWSTPVRWARDYALIVAILVFGNFNDTPFVYFQF
ncbi:MAG: MBOAT family O-acyltransferase [Myxococcota bacterium]